MTLALQIAYPGRSAVARKFGDQAAANDLQALPGSGIEPLRIETIALMQLQRRMNAFESRARQRVRKVPQPGAKRNLGSAREAAPFERALDGMEIRIGALPRALRRRWRRPPPRPPCTTRQPSIATSTASTAYQASLACSSPRCDQRKPAQRARSASPCQNGARRSSSANHTGGVVSRSIHRAPSQARRQAWAWRARTTKASSSWLYSMTAKPVA